jgi:hypothetical protein
LSSARRESYQCSASHKTDDNALEVSFNFRRNYFAILITPRSSQTGLRKTKGKVEKLRAEKGRVRRAARDVPFIVLVVVHALVVETKFAKLLSIDFLLLTGKTRSAHHPRNPKSPRPSDSHAEHSRDPLSGEAEN